LCFDGTPISARNIRKQILQQIPGSNVTPLRRESASAGEAG
jgi:2-oxoglutarate ferredoxin oxidoreductase subunit alpha